MGASKRDGVIQDFIKLPGVSPRIANQLYDMGFQSLKELSKAEANYLFRLGLNRQLASNIERVMDLWEDSAGDGTIDDAVAVFKGKKPRRGRERGDSGGNGSAQAPSGYTTNERIPAQDDGEKRSRRIISVSGRQPASSGTGEVRSSKVMTADGEVRKMQVCSVCKNLVSISNDECPYCRDNVAVMPADTFVTEEDELKHRRSYIKRKLRDTERSIGNCDQDGIKTERAKKFFARAGPAFEEDDLDKAEKMLKKTIALLEMEKLNRKKELEQKRRRLSGEIDEDGNEIRWDLTNKGRLALWRKWRAGLASFVTPPSFQDKKYARTRSEKMAHYIRVLFWLFMIGTAIVLIVLFIITLLIYFGFLDITSI